MWPSHLRNHWQPRDTTHCHCTTYRKAHGAAFSSVSAVQISDFNFTSGESLIKSFNSSPDKVRCFYSNCGSHIYAHREGQSHYILRLGTLDDDPIVRPVNHIWLSDKAPWYDLEADCDTQGKIGFSGFGNETLVSRVFESLSMANKYKLTVGLEMADIKSEYIQV